MRRAHALRGKLLQVRCAVYNGALGSGFGHLFEGASKPRCGANNRVFQGKHYDCKVARTAEGRTLVGRMVGYARVSTEDQRTARQVDELRAAGCAEVLEERASGADRARPALAALLRRGFARGDTLVVVKLDRLARSTRDLLNTLDAVAARGAGFRSLGDAWADTTTPHGRLTLAVLDGLAEFGRDLIRARTGEGRERAKARGVRLSRKPRLAPAARGGPPPRERRRDAGRDRQELQCQRLDDCEAHRMSRNPQSARRRGTSSPASAPRPSTDKTVVVLKVTLRDIKPPVWRRLVVPATMTLADLHGAIQAAMGWAGGHLHVFDIAERRYGDPRILEDVADETRLTLNGVLRSGVVRFTYTYDLGDNWQHQVLVERTRPALDAGHCPACVAGKRHCPPEDCGGPWGYAELLDALTDPAHPEHADRRAWVDEDFDPEAFDVADADMDVALRFGRK